MKYTFLNITTIISALVSILLLIQGIDFIKVFGIALVVIIVIPLALFLLLQKISKKYSWKLTTKNIATYLLIVFSLFHLLFIEIFFFMLKSDFLSPFSIGPKVPGISQYDTEIKALKKKSGFYDMRHFPDKLPENISNYYFQIEDAFDGKNTNYLKFDSNEKYINDVLNKYKKSCVSFTTNENLYKSGVELYINELKSQDYVCLLHKKEDKERYTSGIAIQKPNTIIFFYADF